MDLPFINATLNAVSSFFLILGFIFIKKKNIPKHKFCMITALITSTAFLSFYLYYHFTAGHFRFAGEGSIRTIYLIILVPHIILAALMVPMIIITFVYAFRGQITSHKKLAKFTLPIWLYVSLTGVILYAYLYILYPGNLKPIEKNQQNTEESK